MSLGIAFKGPEGIVLAADSRVTLNAEQKTGNDRVILPATFDNATKLLRINGQNYVGVITYGLGALGQTQPRTAHSFLPEFEDELTKAKYNRLGVEEFSKIFSDFFMKQWDALMPKPYTGPDMVFIVGGYDEGSPYGRLFQITIPSNPVPIEQNKGDEVFGIVWGGQSEFTYRLISGFDPRLPSLLQKRLNLPDVEKDNIREYLKQNLSIAIPYQFLPLQDCVDLSVLLIKTTIEIQTFLVGVRGVGGAIDVATITRTVGFQPIQQKTVVGQRR